MSQRIAVAALTCLAWGGASVSAQEQNAEQTRGVGVYPGNPAQDLAPVMVRDDTTYRNLALRRPAYQSSAYDYNLTAQLVTDGIVDTAPPRGLATATSAKGIAPKHERELLVDHNSVSAVDFEKAGAWVQFELGGGDEPPRIDRLALEVRPRRRPALAGAAGSG